MCTIPLATWKSNQTHFLSHISCCYHNFCPISLMWLAIWAATGHSISGKLTFVLTTFGNQSVTTVNSPLKSFDSIHAACDCQGEMACFITAQLIPPLIQVHTKSPCKHLQAAKTSSQVKNPSIKSITAYFCVNNRLERQSFFKFQYYHTRLSMRK